MPEDRTTLYESLHSARPGEVIRSPHRCHPNIGEGCDYGNATRQWAWRHKLRFRFFHEGDELWAVRLEDDE